MSWRHHGGRQLTVMPVMVRPLGDPVAGHDRPDDDARTRSGLRVEPVRDGGRLRDLVRTYRTSMGSRPGAGGRDGTRRVAAWGQRGHRPAGREAGRPSGRDDRADHRAFRGRDLPRARGRGAAPTGVATALTSAALRGARARDALRSARGQPRRGTVAPTVGFGFTAAYRYRPSTSRPNLSCARAPSVPAGRTNGLRPSVCWGRWRSDRCGRGWPARRRRRVDPAGVDVPLARLGLLSGQVDDPVPSDGLDSVVGARVQARGVRVGLEREGLAARKVPTTLCPANSVFRRRRGG